MSFRSKIMLVPVLFIGSGLAVWGAAHFTNLWGAVGVAALAVIVLLMLTRNLLVTSADSVDRMNRTVNALAEGKMDMTLRAEAEQESGEVGTLENGLASLALSHHNFKSDLDALLVRMKAGETGLTVDTRNMSGGLREVALLVNAIFNNSDKESASLAGVLDAYARGDFAPGVAGAHPKVAESVDKLNKQFAALRADAAALATAVKVGRFNVRTTGSYSGEWTQLASDLNATGEAMARPLSDITSGLERVESASFSGLSAHMQGDFAKIKEALERINTLYSGHLSELASALNEVSYGRPATLTRDYRGAFQGVQSAVSAVSRAQERLNGELERAKTANNARSTFAAARPVITPQPVPRATGAALGSTGSTLGAAASRTPLGATGGGVQLASGVPRRTPRAGIKTPPTAMNHAKVVVPSGAHEYNRKDFGKYK